MYFAKVSGAAIGHADFTGVLNLLNLWPIGLAECEVNHLHRSTQIFIVCGLLPYRHAANPATSETTKT